MTAPPRTRQRRKEARPAEIIEAGLQEFSLHGLAAARMEDVAVRAGIAKGTVYRYFEDKESLFIAAVRSRIPLFVTPLDEMIDAYPGSSSELLTIIFTRAYGILEHPEMLVLMRIMIAEGAKFPALTELYHREVLSRGRSLLGKVIERGVARGEFRAGPASAMPMLLFSPVLMAALWRMNFERHEHLAIAEILRAHIDLVLHGLETRPESPRALPDRS